MKKDKSQNLSAFNVALMYVSAIMGAGFASGRELWQYLGIFGDDGILGVAFIAVCYCITGYMTAYIAIHLKTPDMVKVVVPGENKIINKAVGVFMAFMLFTVLVTMTAAGSSLLNQQFGVPMGIGGIIIDIMVIATILGGFERISGVFKYVMPVLFATVIISALLIIFIDLPESGVTEPVVASPAIPTWYMGTALYLSYNMLALIPFVAKSAVNAKSYKAGVGGAVLGGIFLGILAICIVIALQQDMPFTNIMDLPMMALTSRISKLLGLWYFLVLFFAIYSAATSNFYGCTTKIKEGPKKKMYIVIISIIAYACGLVGFKNIVTYLFSFDGYVGFAIMIMITINFFKVRNMVKSCKSQ